jgi:hypothetical protein
MITGCFKPARCFLLYHCKYIVFPLILPALLDAIDIVYFMPGCRVMAQTGCPPFYAIVFNDLLIKKEISFKIF